MVENLKVGQNCFTIIDGKAVEISVDFIGDGTVLSRTEDGFIEKKFVELFPDKKSAENQQKGEAMVAICRELNKVTGEVATYVLPGTFESHPPQILSFRSRYNPELTYFFALNREEDEMEELLDLMKDAEACEMLVEENILYQC